MPLTVGTAGHIDHGKTWLVRALTGKDTDRLPEEQARGISIDLGYAPLELPDGRRLSLIDVPGHERFVRNMVAGATGIDLFLLVIDAGEGARPQTHEHLAILRLLGIERGVVAVTKADAVDAETLELAVAEARGARARRGGRRGEREDRRRARRAARRARAPQRWTRERAEWPTRLFVDRVFTLRGIGTVVTGTLWSGTLAEGDELRAEPGGARRPRAEPAGPRPAGRGARMQDSASRSRCRGSSGASFAAATRSSSPDVPGQLPARHRADELEPIADGARLNVHHGTSQHRGARRARGRALRAASSRRAARRRARRPRRAAHAHDRRRRRRARPGPAAHARHAAPRAAGARRRGGDRPRDRARAGDGPELQARGCSRQPSSRAGSLGARAGDWYFSEAWLEELRRACASACASARRANRSTPASRRPAPARPPVGERDRAAARARAPRRQGLPARQRAVPRRPRGGRARSRPSSPSTASARSTTASWRLPRAAGRLYRVGDGFAVSRRAVRAHRTRAIQTLDADHARRLPRRCSASRAASRSCCSSATTPTGSRAESATSAFYAASTGA